jgi:hypothetical protein
MTERKRAALVLFVDSESGADDEVDFSFLVKAALHQSGAFKDGLKATIMGNERSVRVVDVVGVGMAAGNGYLWTEPTTKAWRQAGVSE